MNIYMYMYGIINIYTYVYILLIIFQIGRFGGDFWIDLNWKLRILRVYRMYICESRGDDG